MVGTPDNPGLIPRCAAELFKVIDSQHAATTDWKYKILFSYLEIYQEKVITFLLAINSTDISEKNIYTYFPRRWQITPFAIIIIIGLQLFVLSFLKENIILCVNYRMYVKELDVVSGIQPETKPLNDHLRWSSVEVWRPLPKTKMLSFFFHHLD